MGRGPEPKATRASHRTAATLQQRSPNADRRTQKKHGGCHKQPTLPRNTRQHIHKIPKTDFKRNHMWGPSQTTTPACGQEQSDSKSVIRSPLARIIVSRWMATTPSHCSESDPQQWHRWPGVVMRTRYLCARRHRAQADAAAAFFLLRRAAFRHLLAVLRFGFASNSASNSAKISSSGL